MNSTETCNKLNELIAPILEEVEKDLNKWSYGETNGLPEPGNVHHVATIRSLGNATIAKRSEDVFNLEPVFAGMIKDVPVKLDELGDQIVIRRMLGYSLALRIVEGSVSPNEAKPLIKEMVMKLIETRGFTADKLNKGIYGTFKRPGSETEYFREMEYSAGYELRLYSSTTLAEKL